MPVHSLVINKVTVKIFLKTILLTFRIFRKIQIFSCTATINSLSGIYWCFGKVRLLHNVLNAFQTNINF